ncbi:MAG: hypothetical protein JWP59_1044 [Massilia sp.]|nr:hypothetical protein [Massilia sp.]
MFSSIRHRLFAALAGFTVLICVCYTALALVVAYVTEDTLVDRLLEREAAGIAAHFTVHRQLKTPADPLIAIYTDQAALPPVVRRHLAAGSRRAEIFTDTGQHYHLRTLELAGGAPAPLVYLLADVAPLLVVSKVIGEVGGVLLGVALALTGLALLLAWWLSHKMVRPLQVLAAEVRELAPGAAISLSAAGRPDEIGYLADKLAAAIAGLQAALAREHAFTRDVSHELRTPLTVMRNTLGTGAGTGAALAADAVDELRAGVAEMAGTIDVLFALARAEHVQSAVFDLRGCIEESLLRLFDTGDRDPCVLDMQLAERLPVGGNVQLTALLLNNCLGNALFHGGPACRLRISMADGVLHLDNTIDSARPATTQGFLHGQNLLRRIAAAIGWHIAFYGGAAEYRVEIVPLPE